MRKFILLFFAIFVLISETKDVFAQSLTEEEYYKQKALEEEFYSRHFSCLANGGEATPQPIITPI